MRMRAAAASSTAVTTKPETSPGFTVHTPNRLIWLVSWSTASRIIS